MTTAGPTLFAYDGSDEAQRALAEGAARLAPTEAVVVSVWESAERATGLARVALPDAVTREALAKLEAAAEAEALELAEAGATLLAQHGWNARAVARSTTTNTWAAVLAAQQESGATTVVAGSRGRSGIKAAVLGSTSAGLVQNSPVPVLIVR